MKKRIACVGLWAAVLLGGLVAIFQVTKMKAEEALVISGPGLPPASKKDAEIPWNLLVATPMPPEEKLGQVIIGNIQDDLKVEAFRRLKAVEKTVEEAEAAEKKKK